MKLRPTRLPAARSVLSPAIDLTWSHFGAVYRVTPWPEARLERRDGDAWIAVAAGEGILASGAVQLNATAWRRYLEFIPAAERSFLERFRFGRLATLLILARCPGLLADLDETPALAPFLAAHTDLRGSGDGRWDEVAAVHERGGVYAVLEWLGLPARRETFSILRNLADPDVPRRLLEPLRSLLWQPEAAGVLQRLPQLTDIQLAQYCNRLAA